MFSVYATGAGIAVVGFAIWQLFDTTPTDIVGVGLFAIGLVIAGSIELMGLLMLPLRALDWLDHTGRGNSRDRKAVKAAKERAAARRRTAEREVSRQQARESEKAGNADLATGRRPAHPRRG